MFEAIKTSDEQVRRFYLAAAKDLRLAVSAKAPDLVFYACYNVIVKTSMALCAKNGLRVKSRAGHHTELISKLAEYLKDPETEDVANQMRKKRNRDLYDGGTITTLKEADAYLLFCKKLLKEAGDYLYRHKLV